MVHLRRSSYFYVESPNMCCENGVKVVPSLSWWEALAPTFRTFCLVTIILLHCEIISFFLPPHRCLKWHTQSSARGAPCGGRWLGVSMTTWWRRWVFADCFVAIARPDLFFWMAHVMSMFPKTLKPPLNYAPALQPLTSLQAATPFPPAIFH